MATREETSTVTIPDTYIRDETLKVSKKIESKRSTLKDIGIELEKLRTTGIYPYINNISPQNLFLYTIILLVSVLISNYIPWMLKDVMGLVIGLGIIYYLNEGKRASYIDRLKTTEIHMEQIIPRPTFFYKDANFIEFAYTMMPYQKYNKTAFFKMIEAIDHFLEIQIDIEKPELKNCTETYQVAVDMRDTALNELHSIIHSMPIDDQQILDTKLVNAVKTLQLYMQRHLDEMLEFCNMCSESAGWNIETKKIDKYAIPGVDKTKNQSYHVF